MTQRRAQLLYFGMLALLPILLFFAFYHPAIIDPYNFGWLLRGTDNGENALGLHAWLNDPGTGRSLKTTLLNAPEGVPLLFTDSNPLVSMIVAPIARLMGPDVQFVGIWIMLCLVLQAAFAHALLRRYAPSLIALWLGVAMLMLMPSLYARYVHANLQAHWLLLWALWIFVDARRARDARWWITALCITALIHNYMLIQVAAVWGSAMLERFFTQRTIRQKATLMGEAVATLALVAMVVGCLGINFDFVPTRSYNYYAMALDALWNPANASYSLFLPAIAQQNGLSFEGFQYLGFGSLLLVASAPFIVWQTPPVEPVTGMHRRLLWLVPACLVLTILALSNSVNWQGRTLFEIPLPWSVITALDPVRAAGRLFWVVSYIIVLAVITIAYRLPTQRAEQFLVLIVFLQFMDLTGMMTAVRRVTADANTHRTWRRTADPRWETAIASAKDITFAPADPIRFLDVFQEVAWRATTAGKPVRVVYSSRDTRTTKARLIAEDKDFVAGRLVASRLYILMPEAVVPVGAASRLMVLDGIRVLVPVRSIPSFDAPRGPSAVYPKILPATSAIRRP
ncbi:MAG: hypothetical protein JWO15_2478 [Sphingomonadales bacterium]|nr:hypothetical protein [Sphingomonadales bacterium]